MPNEAIRGYLQDVGQALKAGNATEHTHRPALKTLLEALGGNDVRATNEPKQESGMYAAVSSRAPSSRARPIAPV